MNIEHQLLELTEVLHYPVLIGAVLCLVAVLIDAGRLFGEIWQRRRRSVERLNDRVAVALVAVARGDIHGASEVLRATGWDRSMGEALAALVSDRQRPEAEQLVPKALADYDYRSLRKLERTRILVRMGPALGLMGTLIPLSPALKGLAGGNVRELTENLSVAFSVTVAGLLIGAFAFGVALIRDRLYAQDYSDVEYVDALLESKLRPAVTGFPPPPPAAAVASAPTSAPTLQQGLVQV